MKATWIRMRLVPLVLVLVTIAAGAACTQVTKPPPETPSQPPPPLVAPPVIALPFVAGSYDCAAATTWKTTSFAGLVPSVERAVANDNPDSALAGLLGTHYAEEVTCVAGYVHDQSVDQQASATDKVLPARRVAATAAFIDQQSSKGLIVTNYRGEAH